MSTFIRENKTDAILIQAGFGPPSHISPIGTLFVDKNNATYYVNKNNMAQWEVLAGVSGGTSYILPIASPSVLGGVKIGSGINVAGDGTISVNFTDVYITGGTYANGTATYVNNTGGTFTVSGFYTGSTEVFVTGGTYSNGTATFTNTTGGTFSVSGFSTGSSGATGPDTYVTGGTYSNGTAVFRNSTGGTFSVSGFSTGSTEIFVTGGTYSAGTAVFKNTTGGTFSVSGFSTGNTFIDTFVTGGTYSAGTTTFTNNTGGTFNISGYYTGSTDVFVTSGTYSGGTAIFVNNTGGTFSISGFSTGSTFIDTLVTGGTYTAGTLTLGNSTGGTFSISGFSTGNTFIDTFVTGGTYTAGTAIFTNTTGGTFSVSGFSTGNTFIDTYVTGGTYSAGTTTFTNSTGGTFSISGFSTGSTFIDTFVTGGTYSAGTAVFRNTTGGTFSVSGFSTGTTQGLQDVLTVNSVLTTNNEIVLNETTLSIVAIDVIETGMELYSQQLYLYSYNPVSNEVGNLVITESSIDIYTTLGSDGSGLTIQTDLLDLYTTDIFKISIPTKGANKWLKSIDANGTAEWVALPTDIFVTGGTYTAGTTTFTNNTGGTFSISGFSTGNTFIDTFVTGGTYSAGTAIFTNTTGGTFSVSGFSTGTTQGLQDVISQNNVLTQDNIIENQGHTFTMALDGLGGSTNYVQIGGLSGAQDFDAYFEDGGTSSELYANSGEASLYSGNDDYATNVITNNSSIELKARLLDNSKSSITLISPDSIISTVMSGTESTVLTHTKTQLNILAQTFDGYSNSTEFNGYYSSIFNSSLEGYGNVYVDPTEILSYVSASGITSEIRLHYNELILNIPSKGANKWLKSINSGGIAEWTTLPTDITVTGGTYSAGTAVFTNNTGGTFSISGFSTGTTQGLQDVITQDNVLIGFNEIIVDNLNIKSGTLDYSGLTSEIYIDAGSVALFNQVDGDTYATLNLSTANVISTVTDGTDTTTITQTKDKFEVIAGSQDFSGKYQALRIDDTFIDLYTQSIDGLLYAGIALADTSLFLGTTGTFKLEIPSRGVNKVLTCINVDGTAEWVALPTDITVTGGTYTAGTATFRNTTGGTFSVSGFSTGTTQGLQDVLTVDSVLTQDNEILTGNFLLSTIAGNPDYSGLSSQLDINLERIDLYNQTAITSVSSSIVLTEGEVRFRATELININTPLITLPQDTQVLVGTNILEINANGIGASNTFYLDTDYIELYSSDESFKASQVYVDKNTGVNLTYIETGINNTLLVNVSGITSTVSNGTEINTATQTPLEFVHEIVDGTGNELLLTLGAGYSSIRATIGLDESFIYIDGNNLKLEIPSKGTIGHVLTSTDTNGTAEWTTLPTDIFVTGGTYSAGTAVFRNTTGGTFSVTGFYTGNTFVDTFVTGGTYSAGTAVFRNNTGGTFSVSGFSTGSTTTGSDTYVTGGTYSAGTTVFRNNTGGTFSVSGYSTGSTFIDTYVTGFTYSNNGFNIINNTGGTLTAVINTVTGLTVTGNLISSTISATTISATTYYGNGANLTGINNFYTTGATINNTSVVFNRNDSLSAYTVNIAAAVEKAIESNFIKNFLLMGA